MFHFKEDTKNYPPTKEKEKKDDNSLFLIIYSDYFKTTILRPICQKRIYIRSCANHNTTVTENWTFQLHLKLHDTGMLCYRFRRPDILE